MKKKQAQQWHNLAKDFEEASAHYSGQAIRLAYRNARSYYGEGFMLLYVKDSESEPGKEVDDESVARANPSAEATFRNVVIRGLRLARQASGTSLWQDWAEFLVDNLPYHQENMQLYGQDRSTYLRSQFFRLVDDSVMVCRQKELKAMTPDPVQPYEPLFADGLQALRRRAGKKQHQLAAVLRCDRSKVSRMENHHEEITEDEIERLLIAFQKQYGWTRGAILGEQVRKE